MGPSSGSPKVDPGISPDGLKTNTFVAIPVMPESHFGPPEPPGKPPGELLEAWFSRDLRLSGAPGRPPGEPPGELLELSWQPGVLLEASWNAVGALLEASGAEKKIS